MKKILIVVFLFFTSLAVTVFIRLNVQEKNEKSPTETLGSAPRNIEILPSPFVKNDATTQSFSLNSQPEQLPNDIQIYTLLPQQSRAQTQELAGRLGFTNPPDTTLENQGILSWESGDKHLTSVNNPPSIKMTSVFTETDVKKIPSPQVAETIAREFIKSSGVVTSPLSIKLLQSTYVNSDGFVFSSVTDPTKPTLIRVDFAYQVDGKQLFSPEGFPLGTTLLVSTDGVKMFMADRLIPEASSQRVKLRTVSDALQLLEQGKGVLVDIEKRNTREGTVLETSFAHFSVASTALGFIWNKETNQLLPCFVFSGSAQSGKDTGVSGLYLVSGADIPAF